MPNIGSTACKNFPYCLFSITNCTAHVAYPAKLLQNILREVSTTLWTRLEHRFCDTSNTCPSAAKRRNFALKSPFLVARTPGGRVQATREILEYHTDSADQNLFWEWSVVCVKGVLKMIGARFVYRQWVPNVPPEEGPWKAATNVTVRCNLGWNMACRMVFLKVSIWHCCWLHKWGFYLAHKQWTCKCCWMEKFRLCKVPYKDLTSYFACPEKLNSNCYYGAGKCVQNWSDKRCRLHLL